MEIFSKGAHKGALPSGIAGAGAEPGALSLVSLLGRAYHYALSLSAHESTAEDLVQEAWLRVVEHYGPEISKPVLFRTIRNLYIDRWRHESRFPTESFDESKSAADGIARDTQDPALDAALRTLGDVERETLFLAVIEGYTAAEIAALTNSPRGSVLSRLHRAKRKLAQLLEPAHQTAQEGAHCAGAFADQGLASDSRRDQAPLATVSILPRRSASGDGNG